MPGLLPHRRPGRSLPPSWGAGATQPQAGASTPTPANPCIGAASRPATSPCRWVGGCIRCSGVRLAPAGARILHRGRPRRAWRIGAPPPPPDSHVPAAARRASLQPAQQLDTSLTPDLRRKTQAERSPAMRSSLLVALAALVLCASAKTIADAVACELPGRRSRRAAGSGPRVSRQLVSATCAAQALHWRPTACADRDPRNSARGSCRRRRGAVAARPPAACPRPPPSAHRSAPADPAPLCRRPHRGRCRRRRLCGRHQLHRPARVRPRALAPRQGGRGPRHDRGGGCAAGGVLGAGRACRPISPLTALLEPRERSVCHRCPPPPSHDRPAPAHPTAQVLHAEARIFLYERFLTDAECDHIIALAGARPACCQHPACAQAASTRLHSLPGRRRRFCSVPAAVPGPPLGCCHPELLAACPPAHIKQSPSWSGVAWWRRKLARRSSTTCAPARCDGSGRMLLGSCWAGECGGRRR